MTAHARLRERLAQRPVLLAPMEDVSDPVFRRLCRTVGADLCVTEFVNVDALKFGCKKAERKIQLGPDDRPTAIQIYGSDPSRLVEAAQIAEAAAPLFIDINCGCWIPRIAERGAGSGWLRHPQAMVAMAKKVVDSVSLPVTVKTRIGVGTEREPPIVDLARRLEDAGISALTLHCRTAMMRHDGEADWTWAARVQAAVRIPVIVNGDIRTADDAVRALEQTGCAAVMIGRAAIGHPWVFREARALIDRGERLPAPSVLERLQFCRVHACANIEARGEPNGVQTLRRHLPGYFTDVPGGEALRRTLHRTDTLAETLALLDATIDRMKEATLPLAS